MFIFHEFILYPNIPDTHIFKIGGFKGIPFSEHIQYPSDLSDNGCVGWSVIETNADEKSVGPIQFRDIRYELQTFDHDALIYSFLS